MIKKVLLISIFILLTNDGFSQIKNHRWSIGINPFSFAESAMSIGPCVSYRLSERIGFWTEGSYIFKNLYMSSNWRDVKGYRGVFQTRYYRGKSRTKFIAAEFRLKKYSFTNENTLSYIKNDSTNTINFSNFEETQFLIGGALLFGKVFFLSKKKNLFLEFTYCVGGKQRFVSRDFIVPLAYSQFIIRPIDGPIFNNYFSENGGTVYFPLALRFYWNL